MDRLLHENRDFSYHVADTFDSKMLIPVTKDRLRRPESEWSDYEDYDEIYRCLLLIRSVDNNADVELDFHTIRKGQSIVGVGFFLRGTADLTASYPKASRLTEGNGRVMLFDRPYTSPEGREAEQQWLAEVIVPYYEEVFQPNNIVSIKK